MSKAHCKAKRSDGAPCGMKPQAGSRYCFNHDPAQARKRAEARKHGGEARHVPHFGNTAIIPKKIKSLDDATKILDYALAEILGHDNSLLRVRALIALFEGFAKSIEIGELEARIAALEGMGNHFENSDSHKSFEG